MSGDRSDEGVPVLRLGTKDVLTVAKLDSHVTDLQAGPREIVQNVPRQSRLCLLNLRRVRVTLQKQMRGRIILGVIYIYAEMSESPNQDVLSRQPYPSGGPCRCRCRITWNHLAVTARVWHASGQDQASSRHELYHLGILCRCEKSMAPCCVRSDKNGGVRGGNLSSLITDWLE